MPPHQRLLTLSGIVAIAAVDRVMMVTRPLNALITATSLRVLVI